MATLLLGGTIYENRIPRYNNVDSEDINNEYTDSLTRLTDTDNVNDSYDNDSYDNDTYVNYQNGGNYNNYNKNSGNYYNKQNGGNYYNKRNMQSYIDSETSMNSVMYGGEEQDVSDLKDFQSLINLHNQYETDLNEGKSNASADKTIDPSKVETLLKTNIDTLAVDDQQIHNDINTKLNDYLNSDISSKIASLKYESESNEGKIQNANRNMSESITKSGEHRANKGQFNKGEDKWKTQDKYEKQEEKKTKKLKREIEELKMQNEKLYKSGQQKTEEQVMELIKGIQQEVVKNTLDNYNNIKNSKKDMFNTKKKLLKDTMENMKKAMCVILKKTRKEIDAYDKQTDLALKRYSEGHNAIQKFFTGYTKGFKDCVNKSMTSTDKYIKTKYGNKHVSVTGKYHLYVKNVLKCVKEFSEILIKSHISGEDTLKPKFSEVESEIEQYSFESSNQSDTSESEESSVQ